MLVDRPALERAEGLMKASGLFNTDQIRPVIEARMWARWKLGQLLAKFQRGTGPGRGKKEAAGQPSFKQSLATLGLNKNTAKQAERIGAMPKKKVERYLARSEIDPDRRHGVSGPSSARTFPHCRGRTFLAPRSSNSTSLHPRL